MRLGIPFNTGAIARRISRIYGSTSALPVLNIEGGSGCVDNLDAQPLTNEIRPSDADVTRAVWDRIRSVDQIAARSLFNRLCSIRFPLVDIRLLFPLHTAVGCNHRRRRTVSGLAIGNPIPPLPRWPTAHAKMAQ